MPAQIGYAVLWSQWSVLLGLVPSTEVFEMGGACIPACPTGPRANPPQIACSDWIGHAVGRGHQAGRCARCAHAGVSR